MFNKGVFSVFRNRFNASPFLVCVNLWPCQTPFFPACERASLRGAVVFGSSGTSEFGLRYIHVCYSFVTL